MKTDLESGSSENQPNAARFTYIMGPFRLIEKDGEKPFG